MSNYRRVWKLFLRDKTWNDSKFKIQGPVYDMCSDDILYCGITLFGWSVIYSDVW